MFGWYLEQIKDHGLVAATWLLWRVSWRRVYVISCNLALPAKLTCPCCGWRGRRFFDYIEKGYTVSNAACPGCDSHSRHRALFMWLRDEFRIQEKAGRALVFAPEKALAPLWQAAGNLRIVRVDLEAERGVDARADLMRLPLKEQVADLIWCHHVIEQVPEVQLALSELRRVLAESGELIVSVGQSSREKTVEFGFHDKALSGNRRSFGADFPQMLTEAGFSVNQIAYELSEEDRRRYGIYPEPFYRCVRN
ncbi:MAG: methyltransferase domain-containing protein [Acidobacteriota bacterium]